MKYRGLAEQKRPTRIILHNTGDKVDTATGVIAYHRRIYKDVGYHYLIERGLTFDGRPMKYQGAHSRGGNDGSIGIAMVGNYMEELPSKPNMEELINRLGKLCFQYKIPVESIIGHRDVEGSNTDCPGNTLYAYLPTIRELVTVKLQEEYDVTKPKGDYDA